MTAASNLLSPQCVRERAEAIYQCALAGETHFRVNLEMLYDTADFVISVMKDQYPDLEIPYHSRWRHFEIDNQPLLDQFNQVAKQHSQRPYDNARLGLDLIIPSVLVDAGAGAKWQFKASELCTLGRSEGLGLASLALFLDGKLSSTEAVQTDCCGIAKLTQEAFEEAFQVSEDNPLTGVEGRLGLLKSLGSIMAAKPEVFPLGRPADLVDYWLEKYGNTMDAITVFQEIVEHFGDIWPSRLELDETNLGDTWHYPPFESGDNVLKQYVPFHKLTQWLTYSVIESLQKGGFIIENVNALTGLAEYRNGGLLIDSGLISLRNPELAKEPHHPSSALIIEWRALTIVLLDKLADQIREQLGLSRQKFPMVKVLEGGTWLAGRKMAEKYRPDLSPPIAIISDGTVF